MAKTRRLRRGRRKGARGRRRVVLHTRPKRSTVRRRRRASNRRRKYAMNPRPRRSHRRRTRRNARGWYKTKGGYKGGVSRVVRRRRRYAMNPRRRSRRYSANPSATIMGQLKDIFSVKSVQTIFAGLIGFGGALALPQMAASAVKLDLYFKADAQGSVVRVLSSGVATGLLAFATGWLTKDRDMVKTVTIGGLIATGWKVLSEMVPADKKATFPIPLLAGMGDSQSEAFRRAIEAEIVKQIGVEGYATQDQIARAVGVSGYATPAQLERAANLTPVGVGADEFDTRAMSERF